MYHQYQVSEIVSFLNRAGILPKQPANASNVILGLNPAFPNVIVEKRLHDGVNQDRWVEVKFRHFPVRVRLM